MKSHTELATEFLSQYDAQHPVDPLAHAILVGMLDYAVAQTAEWDDSEPTPEDDAIHAAFPTRSGRHDLYAEAMRLVGARHSKGSLVALVCWLLLRAEKPSATEPTGQGSIPKLQGPGRRGNIHPKPDVCTTPTGRTDGHGKFCESPMLHQTIQALSADFAAKLIAAIKSASFAELASVTQDAPATPKATRRKGRLARRSPADLARVKAGIVLLLKSHPKGLRSEEIREKLGMSREEMPRPLADALAEKMITKRGQKRATVYSVRK